MIDNTVINNAMDFINHFFKILNINETALYKDNKIFNDKYYRKRLSKVAYDFFNLPDEFITVEKGIVFYKDSNKLHKDLMKFLNRVQKKHYGEQDLLGIHKNSEKLTSFYVDTDHLCEVYTHFDPNANNFKKWIENYSEESVYSEGDSYKFYGGKNERTIDMII